MVISGVQKEYELTSWNEQGEITRSEGMFIIGFLLFLPCFHIDSKPINLMMYIHYTINMPYNSDFPTREQERDRYFDFKFAYQSLKMHYEEIKSQLDEIKEYIKLSADSHEISAPFELKKTIKNILDENKKLRVENRKSTIEIQKLNDKINQLTDRVSELETTVNRKNKEIITFEKHNTLMSELLDERKSGWIIRRDLAIRTNPVPDEKNEFGYPLNFDEENVYNLHSNEENSKWCHFKYYSKDGISELKEYDMPWSLYEFLSGRLQSNIKTKEIKKTPKKSGLVKFDSSESLLKYFKETLGDKFYSYTLIDIFVSFIFENIKKPIDLENARSYCEIKRGKKPVPATIHKHLNLLIEHKIIYRKHKGIYEVNEQSINFD